MSNMTNVLLKCLDEALNAEIAAYQLIHLFMLALIRIVIEYTAFKNNLC